MKPRLRDYLTIFFALMVIFLCGTGVGYLLGEKKGRAHDSTKVPPKPTKSRAWEERTMVRLTESLDLSEAQQRTIREDVEEAAQKIATSRDQAIGDYYRHLLTLHDDLLPDLEPSQQKKITKDREKLKQLLESRFQSNDVN